MYTELLALAARATALKVPHQYRIHITWVDPKRGQSAIEQIRCCPVPPGKSAKIGRRNSKILRYACDFHHVACGEFIGCRSSCQKGFHDLSK
jgi:hypothetical protein